MSEVVNNSQSPEEVVFGEAYSFSGGGRDHNTVRDFLVGRMEQIESGAKTWLPRALDSDHGVCADLYEDKKIIATLDVEFGYGSSVYVTSEGGTFGDTTLVEYVSFDDAVAAAELFAAHKRGNSVEGLAELQEKVIYEPAALMAYLNASKQLRQS